MDNIKKTLENWLNELNNFSFKNYEELPDIEPVSYTHLTLPTNSLV